MQPECTACSVPRDCEHVAWFSATERVAFGVAWKCPRCGDRKLVVSPIGPSRVTATTCLHCGSETASAGSGCTQCGTSVGDVLSESERALPDDALLALARDAFAVGTCRRGLTIANFVLQRAPRSEAASIKAQFLEHLDAQQPFSPS